LRFNYNLLSCRFGFRRSEDEKLSIGRQRPEDIIACGEFRYDGKPCGLGILIGGAGEYDVRQWEAVKVRDDV